MEAQGESMKNLSNKKIATNIIRVSLLRNIFFACLAIVITFQIYALYFLYPSFNGLLIKSAEDDAIFAATHLSRMIIPENLNLRKNSISNELINEIKKLVYDFKLEKLKIFLNSGEIIYSTNTEDMGNFNKEKYFHEIVSEGNVYTNVVQKDTTTLEGRVVRSDVVETYVPIIRNGIFGGAFEIYYNITDKKKELGTLLSRSSFIMIIISVGLLVGITVILYQASKTIIERSMAEDALKRTHLELEQRVEERTAELTEANKKLLQEIAERKLIEKALRESEGKLHILSSHLLTAQERERRRISLELHDELGQSLTVLKLQIRSIDRNLPMEQKSLKENCENTLLYVDQIIENTRRLSMDLSPSILQDLGLTAAIGWLVEDFAKHSDISVTQVLLDIDNLFSSDSQIVIFRIFQEAFTNIGKHAQAKQILVTFEKMENRVNFLIADDGKGFVLQEVESRYPTEKTLGLMALDERARMLNGELKIDTKKSGGTRIKLSVPIGRGGSNQ